MKRSRSIRLVLLGGLSAGALAGCVPPSGHPSSISSSEISSSAVFTNNHHVPGVGYYHAPFRAWFSLPYNYYEPRSSQYYYGGQWGATPHESVVNLSSPNLEAIRQVAAQRTDVRRGGFGSTGRHFSSFSS